jgi:hypothetical protein
VLPSPRHAEAIEGTWVRLGPAWQVSLEQGVVEGDIAVRTLRGALAQLPNSAAAGRIVLRVAGHSVETGVSDGRDLDAYLLQVAPTAITLSANGASGLFYGVQTLLQLMAGRADGKPGELPAGRIEDWPEYELRCLHWDTKHHQDRPETLRRFLDQAAAFKINTIVYEIEDKFAFPSHPVVGAPGAWTPAELQSLVNYALERHMQVIPDLQAPAHVGFILKHEEFAHLRCDGSRYQICMDDPAARKLLFELYDDLCAATQGCKYFLVSTDEVYYAGICERFRKPYNPENRSLTWVDYVKAAHAHLTRKQGRRTIVWVEYPILPEHVSLLPKDLLDGVGPAASDLQAAISQHGLAQFAYASMQGEELLYPNNFPWSDREGKKQPGRLQQASEALRRAHHVMPRCMGTVGAAWDDSGLHNETFWLGWSVVAQGSWNPAPAVDETMASFLRLHHGAVAPEMDAVYRALDAGARFYERTLERLPSNCRTPGYGNSRGKRATGRNDWGMVPPPLPDAATFSFTPVFRPRYAAVLAEVPEQLAANRQLLERLDACLARADRNRHALEVFRSIALLQRRHLEILQAVVKAEDLLAEGAGQRETLRVQAGKAAAGVREALAALEETYAMVCRTWEIGRFPKGRSVDGRTFLHVMDDVKDHIADRTPDLRYLIGPDLRIGLSEWAERLETFAR